MPISLFPTDYRVREESLTLLPSGHNSVRILHISDLHLHPRDRRQFQWLQRLHETKPDFVIATGDFLGGDYLELVFEALSELLTIPGAFVLGSNDYFAPSFKSPHRYLLPDSRKPPRKRLPSDQLISRMEASWINLTHHSRTISINGNSFHLRGTDDGHLDLDHYELVAGSAAGDLRIGVTHAPYQRIINAMESDGVELLFAGHTHGGQWCWPGGRAIVTNCDLAPRYARGLSRHGRLTLEVCAGSGTSPYAPLRLFCGPEAALITLTS